MIAERFGRTRGIRWRVAVLTQGQDVEPDARASGSDEAKAFGRCARDVDNHPTAPRPGRWTAIDNPHLRRSPVLKIRDADDGPERIRRVTGHHRVAVEANPARGDPAVEAARVVRRQADCTRRCSSLPLCRRWCERATQV
jgi:hypothetical protein